jgi:tetratricopeptide (TPR) repeat protein
MSMFERVLEYQREHMGEDHPTTLKTRSNLALVYQELKFVDKSVEMNSDILEQKRRVLGDKHPSVLVSMVNLGGALESAGEDERSRVLLSEALDISRETLGDLHQYTLIIRNNLASYYYRHEEYETARGLALQACEGLSESLGDRHPMTLQGRANLADILLDMGSIEESLQLSIEISDIAWELFETTDRRLGLYSERVAKCYQALGRLDDAERHFTQAAGVFEVTHGKDSEQFQRVQERLESLMLPSMDD